MRYDPSRSYEVKSHDVEYRSDGDGPLLARVYEPQGAGPFPALLRVHGGAWVRGDRLDQEKATEALAVTGLLVVSIDFRQAPAHPYPAALVDVNYATRWLRVHARDFNGDATRLGAHGNASGGHLAVLSGMCPREPRYSAYPLREAPEVDASLDYIITVAPILDPYARYLFAEETGREDLTSRTVDFFVDRPGMEDGNPQLILERREAARPLPPILIIQGADDANVTPAMQERFAAAYRAAGGEVQLEILEDMSHGLGGGAPGARHADGLMQEFIARHLAISC